jgi:hypothetical protein
MIADTRYSFVKYKAIIILRTKKGNPKPVIDFYLISMCLFL